MINLTCSNCGASLEIDLDNIQVFCPHCGHKLMIPIDHLSDLLIEKEKTKRDQLQMEHEIRTKNESYRIEVDKNRRSWKLVGILYAILATVFIFVMIYASIRNHSYENKHAEQIHRLEQIEQEVYDAIKNEDYDLARLKVNDLYLIESGSNEEKAMWDAKRESLISIIEKKDR